MSGNSWVTLATNDSYSLGALVLALSLKRAGTVHNLTVMVTPGVSASMRDQLSSVFNVVQEVNILDSKDETNLKLLTRPELGVTFTKLHCWRLTQFSKCVFLDADVLVLRNCDELFDREELSAAPDVGWPDCFNSGVFVYRPSIETYKAIINLALSQGSFDGGDQGLLNQFFSDWATKDISRHLPFIYNMCSSATYSYLPAFKQFGKDVKIVHFIGSSKPWLQYLDSETRQVRPSLGSEHLQGLLQLWWDIFCNDIHSKLSPDMAGLAGALSQLTLGVARTPEQIALEEHLRKQAWEHGNIDYMGKDSFDNIWQKICQTLAEPLPDPHREVYELPTEVSSVIVDPILQDITSDGNVCLTSLQLLHSNTLEHREKSAMGTLPGIPSPPQLPDIDNVTDSLVSVVTSSEVGNQSIQEELVGISSEVAYLPVSFPVDQCIPSLDTCSQTVHDNAVSPTLSKLDQFVLHKPGVDTCSTEDPQTASTLDCVENTKMENITIGQTLMEEKGSDGKISSDLKAKNVADCQMTSEIETEKGTKISPESSVGNVAQSKISVEYVAGEETYKVFSEAEAGSLIKEEINKAATHVEAKNESSYEMLSESEIIKPVCEEALSDSNLEVVTCVNISSELESENLIITGNKTLHSSIPSEDYAENVTCSIHSLEDAEEKITQSIPSETYTEKIPESISCLEADAEKVTLDVSSPEADAEKSTQSISSSVIDTAQVALGIISYKADAGNATQSISSSEVGTENVICSISAETDTEKITEDISSSEADIAKVPQSVSSSEADVAKVPQVVSSSEADIAKVPQSVSSSEADVSKLTQSVSLPEAGVENETNKTTRENDVKNAAFLHSKIEPDNETHCIVFSPSDAKIASEISSVVENISGSEIPLKSEIANMSSKIIPESNLDLTYKPSILQEVSPTVTESPAAIRDSSDTFHQTIISPQTPEEGNAGTSEKTTSAQESVRVIEPTPPTSPSDTLLVQSPLTGDTNILSIDSSIPDTPPLDSLCTIISEGTSISSNISTPSQVHESSVFSGPSRAGDPQPPVPPKRRNRPSQRAQKGKK